MTWPTSNHKSILLILASGTPESFCPRASAQPFFPPAGSVLFHNGSSTSRPPGSGAVDFFYGQVSGGPILADCFETSALQVDPACAADPNPFLWARSYVFNHTSESWTGFQILLRGADFAGHSYLTVQQAPEDNPVVEFTGDTSLLDTISPDRLGLQHYLIHQVFSLTGSAITRFNDQGGGFRDSELIMTFGDPIDPGKTFALHFNIIPSLGASGEPGFTAYFTPIPEPLSLALFGAGVLFTIGTRRHAQPAVSNRVALPLAAT